MQKQVVIFSLSLAAVSTGTAVWLALRGPISNEGTASTSPNPARPSAAPATTADKVSPAPGGGTKGILQLGLPPSASSHESVELAEAVSKPADRPARPSSIAEVPATELAKRVALVEKETNHEMRRLVGLLNLTEDQQDQVYEKLAASSRHWVPGMAIAADGGGVVIPDSPKTASGAVTDASEDIMALLNADQQETLLTAEMDRAAWWAEIITQLDSQTDIPALDGTPSTPAEPEVKAYEGSDTLE